MADIEVLVPCEALCTLLDQYSSSLRHTEVQRIALYWTESHPSWVELVISLGGFDHGSAAIGLASFYEADDVLVTFSSCRLRQCMVCQNP